MSFIPNQTDIERIPRDIQTVYDGRLDMSRVPDTKNRVTLPRTDYERLLEAAGNLASCGPQTALTTERQVKAERILGELVLHLDSTHIMYDEDGVEKLIDEAAELYPELQ